MKISESPFVVDETTAAQHEGIDPDRHNQPSGSGPPVTPPRSPAVSPSKPKSRRPRDRMDASRNVGPFSAAFEVARHAPAIRQSLVREMRELVGSGRAGSDVSRLALRLIDSIETLSVLQLRSTKRSGPRLIP